MSLTKFAFRTNILTVVVCEHPSLQLHLFGNKAAVVAEEAAVLVAWLRRDLFSREDLSKNIGADEPEEQPIHDGYVEERYYLVKQLRRHRDVGRCYENPLIGRNDGTVIQAVKLRQLRIRGGGT